jgi:hypothetical protein
MKKDNAERVYEESIKPLSTFERLWLVEKIISELRRQSTERADRDDGQEPGAGKGSVRALAGLLGRPSRSVSIEQMDEALRERFGAS